MSSNSTLTRIARLARVGLTVAAPLALVIATTIPGVLSAQATLRGRVVDSETGRPLAGASIVRRNAAPATTDSLGGFVVPELEAGELRLTIRLLGYAAGEFRVQMPATGVVDETFGLDFTGDRLSEVVVRARAEELSPRYIDFETRRQRGVGAFLRWDELKRNASGSVGDALRRVRGVRIQCNQQTYECHAVMARTPRCQPTWFIDGMEAGSFNENTPIRDVYGIEIYRGPGEIPGEFAGSNAGCGVIVMWTKSRPYR